MTEAVVSRLDVIAAESVVILKRQARDVLLLGALWAEARGLCAYGTWLEWIESSIPLGYATVASYIKVWERFGHSVASESDALYATSIIMLASDSTPQSAIEEVATKAAALPAGDKLAHGEVRRIVGRHRALAAIPVVGQFMLEAGVVTAAGIRSAIEIAAQAASEAAVEFDGEQHHPSALFADTVSEHTDARKRQHIAANYAVDVYALVRVLYTQDNHLVLESVDGTTFDGLPKSCVLDLIIRQKAGEAAA